MSPPDRPKGEYRSAQHEGSPLNPRRRQLMRVAARVATAATAASSGLGRPALAQTDLVHLVVPYPAGGPLDLVARSLAEHVTQTLGTVVVDNRPGAGGNIGAALVARAAPDGRTLVMGAVATHAINPWLYAHLPYDPMADFTPITLVALVPNVLVMSAQTAAKWKIASVADLLACARARPGALNFGSGGNGSAGHLAGELLKARTGISAVHIPYPGAAPAQLALLSGQVDFSFDNLASAAGAIRSGKLRALAVTSRQCSSAMPELPTLMEAGVPDFDISTWFGLFGPAHLGQALTARLNQAFVDALATPGLRAQLALMMAEPSPSTPAQFAAFVKSEWTRYRQVVQISGARVE